MIFYYCPRAAATTGDARGGGGTRGGQGVWFVSQGLTPLATPGRPHSGAPEGFSYTLSASGAGPGPPPRRGAQQAHVAGRITVPARPDRDRRGPRRVWALAA